MKYIISGEDKELGKVIRENSIRVARGLIKFEPVPAESSEDTNEPDIDAKEPTSDVKAPRKNKK